MNIENCKKTLLVITIGEFDVPRQKALLIFDEGEGDYYGLFRRFLLSRVESRVQFESPGVVRWGGSRTAPRVK